MGKYHLELEKFFQTIVDEAEKAGTARRKAILLNYRDHAALEYTDRWPEIFDPVRTVENPFYRVHWNTPEEVVYDGIDAVKEFYGGVKGDIFLTNEDQFLAVSDWGFASFTKINLFMGAETARSMGHDARDESAQYVFATPAAMYWTYDERERLISEFVYEIAPGAWGTVAEEDRITYEEIQSIVARHLPPLPRAAA